MAFVQTKSAHVPVGREVGRLMFEASRRAEAMGLLEPDAAAHVDLASVRLLANRVRKAGIAGAPAAALNEVDAPTSDELASLLRLIIAALEASPVPKFAWAGLARVFDA